MLQQLKGVEAISIDLNQGTVTVIGKVNPIALVKFFHKMGIKAKLQYFDKEPLKSKDDCYHTQTCKSKQKAHCCCNSSSYSDDEQRQHKTRHGQRSKKGNTNFAAEAGTGYNHQPPMQGYQYAGEPLSYGMGQLLHPFYRRPSLLSYYNPIIRYTSYAENYRHNV
ncbi:putative heavy metal-associated domain, HMA [Lupinus albus]|uniref:Putative heavy metal-associated domain, HMA n=1 Tax=Lupinus albus TaxID=3870 RepID=A0A6A4PJQ7_LUPAL|nr:putative heavy metal-associated domain, HMA [Lupinus albus]